MNGADTIYANIKMFLYMYMITVWLCLLVCNILLICCNDSAFQCEGSVQKIYAPTKAKSVQEDNEISKSVHKHAWN